MFVYPKGDGAQSPDDSRDIKPRLALADIKPRINSATPDIKPRFHHSSMEETDFLAHFPHDALPLDDMAPCSGRGDGMTSISDVAPSASSRSDNHSMNCAGSAAGSPSDNAEAVRATNPHYSLLPVVMRKVECASVISSVHPNTPVSGVNVDSVASSSHTVDSTSFPEASLKCLSFSGTPVLLTSAAVSECYDSDLHLPAYSGLKSAPSVSPSSGDRRDVVDHPHTSAAPSTSMAILPLLASDSSATDSSLDPDASTGRVPSVVPPTDAQAPRTTAVAPPLPPPVNTAARGGSSEPLKVVFNCPHCDRSFDARSALMTHLYTHYSE